MTDEGEKKAAQVKNIREKFEAEMFKRTRGKIRHDPRSLEIYRHVQAADTVLNYFHWTTGKHGASGEILLFELDMLFAALDSKTTQN